MEIIVGLIRGRHALPVDKYIFSEELRFPLDYVDLDKTVMKFINANIEFNICSGTGINCVPVGGGDHLYYKGNKRLVVYVTGLTPCTASLIKVCARNGVALTLMHYDPTTQTYSPQVIF